MFKDSCNFSNKNNRQPSKSLATKCDFFYKRLSHPCRQVSMANRFINLSLSIFISLSCSVAFADDHGIYAGVGLANVKAGEQSIESSKTGFRLISGYSFNKYFAAEAALFNVGDHKKIGMKGNGYSLSVLGQYPVYNQFNVFVELGGMIVDLKVDEGRTTVDLEGEDSLKDGKDPGSLIAFGVAYDLKAWTLALKSTSADTDADLNIISLNAYYNF
ncbi:MAG: hypothetical protein ACI84K_001613 [Pseudohongiellaceae bacterium]|jgi:hypothetical protein